MPIGDRLTNIVTTTATNIDANADGGAVLIDLNIASSWDGTVDFQATLDGVNYFNLTYITLGTLTPAWSISQLTSLSTTRYILIGPITQFRINCGAGTTGTLTAIYRIVPSDSSVSLTTGGGGGAGTQVEGTVASDGVLAGNPVRIGGAVDDTSPTAAGEGDVRDFRSSPEGNLLVESYFGNGSVHQAASVDTNEGISADVEPAVAAAAGLRVVGWVARETAGSAAVATFRIMNGADVACGVGIVGIELSANQSAGDWYGPEGLDVANGLTIDIIAGTVDVYLYHKTIT